GPLRSWAQIPPSRPQRCWSEACSRASGQHLGRCIEHLSTIQKRKLWELWVLCKLLASVRPPGTPIPGHRRMPRRPAVRVAELWGEGDEPSLGGSESAERNEPV